MIQNPLKIYEWHVLTGGSGLRQVDHVLDLGCGKGHWSLNLARRCTSVLGIDTAPNQIAFAERFRSRSLLRGRVRFICGKLEDQSLPGATFDRAFSFCVLEHIPNLDQVLLEVCRLLKPGGELHVSVDSLGTIKDRSLIERHRQDNAVHQYFSLDSINSQLKAAGLVVNASFPILTGEFARTEFERRIRESYKQGPFARLSSYRRFQEEDRQNPGAREGIMLVARAAKPL